MTTPSSDGAKTHAPTKTKIELIAVQNDKFRALQDRTNTYITLELVGKGHGFLTKLLSRLKDTTKPIGEMRHQEERDYGYFTIESTSVEWSIDYYDLDGESDAKHPENSDATIRTMTIEKG